MALPLGLVTFVIFLSAGFIFLRYRRDFRLTRFVVVVTSALLLGVSLSNSTLSLSIAALIAASEIGLMPIAIYDFEEDQKHLFRSFIGYQLSSHLFLIFSVLLQSDEGAFLIANLSLGMAIFLRLILPFSSKGASRVCLSVAPWARILFLLSNFVFAVMVSRNFSGNFAYFLLVPFVFSIANLYWADTSRERAFFAASALVCSPFFLTAILPANALDFSLSLCLIATVAFSGATLSAQRLVALETAPSWFLIVQRIDVLAYHGLGNLASRISLICRRFAGPIFVEWLFIPTVIVISSILRWASRLFSYAGIPKLVVTSIIISMFLFVYLLKV